ncbi:poly(A) polymerase, Cid1 family protein, partial [Gregarina niphandrodes]
IREWRHLRPLILILKLLLREHDLNETYKGGVGSYMLFNMVTHHLQQEAKSRASKQRKSANRRTQRTQDCDEGITRTPPLSTPLFPLVYDSLADYLEEDTLGNLLVSFLRRYTNFDYVFDGIDIRGNGQIIRKSEYCDEPNDRLYVVSPLEPHLDVGKSTYKMTEVIEVFEKTYLVGTRARTYPHT